MSETLKVIFSMCMVSLALAALIVNSIGNLRADVNLIRTELIDTRKEVRENGVEIVKIRAKVNGFGKDMDGLRTQVDGLRTEVDGLRTEVDGLRTEVDGLRTEVDGLRTEMDKFGQGQQALTERVTSLEELVQGVLLPRRGATAKNG